MKYIKGADRKQLTFLPDCIEEYIHENNSVRVIDWTIVNKVDKQNY